MSDGLKISKTLTLPLDAVTQKFGDMGRTGSGKTYGATKRAEEMLDAGAQVIALDPVGVWYGLRIGADGNPGYSIPVFGGLHGDVALASTSGAMVADLIVDRGISCVLDVSQFETNTEKARFALAFADRFFFRKKAAPSAVHLFLEECQEFVPQNAQPGEQHMLGVFERLIKLGRNFGIGVSLISQRPQEVNKKALEQVECLLAYQMTGTRSRKAIEDWASTHELNEDLGQILPTLPIGEPFIYSPQWLQIAKRIKIAKKKTADVSATPTVGAGKREERPLTPVDVQQLQAAMAATVEQAKADDPKELRKRIRDLEDENAALFNTRSGFSKAELAEEYARGYGDGELFERARWRETVKTFSRQIAALNDHIVHVSATSNDLGDALAQMVDEATSGERSVHAIPVHRAPAPAPVRRPAATARRPVDGLKAGQQKILNALAELEVLGVNSPGRYQLGMVAGYNLTGGTGAQHIADLGKLGLVHIGDGVVTLNANGRAAADVDGAPTTLAELHERVLRKLSSGQRRIAEYLIKMYPDSISREDLGHAVDYNLTGGTGAQHVADLVTVGAAEIPVKGRVAASRLLFPDSLSRRMTRAAR